MKLITHLRILFIFIAMLASLAVYGKTNQTITFGSAPSIVVGGTGTVSANASSGLSVTYTSTTSRVCRISGATVTGRTAGNCVIAANQAGNITYNPAPTARQTIIINKANQALLTVYASPNTITNAGAGSTLSTTGGTGTGVVTFAATASSGVTCKISGTTLTATGSAGSCSVTATKAADSNYNSATSAAIAVSVTAAKATTTTTLSVTPMTQITGRNVTLKATVTGANPSGTVTFNDGTSLLGFGTLIGGNATLFTPKLVTIGTHSVTASYPGDNNNTASNSGAVSVSVVALPNVSINSTSVDSSVTVTTVVSEQPKAPNSSYNVLAVNDLGMHCVDNDTRIVNILPPFQVMLGQIIQKSGKPVLNPAGASLYYSAASNPLDPILSRTDVFNGLSTDGTTFKTDFWDNVDLGGYDTFYPPLGLPPGATLGALVKPDYGLLVPNVEQYYIAANGTVVPTGDPTRLAVNQQATPGVNGPYAKNDPQKVNESYKNKPFFIGFPFGYVAENVNWFEAPGTPLSPFDDLGRQNSYPIVRVQAKDAGGTVLASVDTVLPVSSESSCTNCHGSLLDEPSVGPGSSRRTTRPIDLLKAAGLLVASSDDDPKKTLPLSVSIEYGADINILRLHDLKHGSKYVFPTATNPTGASSPCDIKSGLPASSNGDVNCLANKAIDQQKPVVCQTCHYTPALDLLQVGPKSGVVGSDANGRNQLAHQSNSRVMHNSHGSLMFSANELPLSGPMFTTIPAPIQGTDSVGNGIVTNQAARNKALEENCYQCHPGKDTKCLRGAMFNAGVLCSDCHGDLQKIGNDFTKNVTTTNPMPGALVNTLGKDFYNPSSATPRVPWANEPGCGSCHTGHATDNLARSASANIVVNAVDSHGVIDNIRLRQAYLTGDLKATPIVPGNKTFAEPAVAASFNGFNNPGSGNPKLYRVSTGHGGVMCEGCHGPTHAEWPVANPNANDNVTAQQLQGHSGTISECSTCHTTSGLLANTQKGPHGMHLVNDGRFWQEAHKDAAKAQNSQPGRGTCGSCHGSDHLGTVLSRVPVSRTFSVEGVLRTVQAGKPVACNLCHSLNKSFGG
jgi:hypothetical protein